MKKYKNKPKVIEPVECEYCGDVVELQSTREHPEVMDLICPSCYDQAMEEFLNKENGE